MMRQEWRRPTGVLADLLRVAALASVLAALVWYPMEAVIRFGLVLLVLLVPRLIRVPRPFDAAFGATLLLAAWAGVAHWYTTVVWMDEAVHLVTPGATAAMCYLVLACTGLLPRPQDPTIRRHRSSVTLLVLSLGLTVASLWELYEWTANRLLAATIQVGYDDTISDLALGGLGSLLAGLVLAWWAASGYGPRLRTDARPKGHEITSTDGGDW